MLLLDYLYRDANNYKASRRFLLDGDLSEAEIAEIRAKLDAGLYFIPADVGLEPADDLQQQFGYDEEADHPWHELVVLRRATEAECADEIPLCELTAQDLLDNFRIIEGWDA